MNEMLKLKIRTILSHLSPEQCNKDILELENSPENHQIIAYIESIGAEKVGFETTAKLRFGSIQEKSGITYLWYKKPNGVWIIKLWEINRLVK